MLTGIIVKVLSITLLIAVGVVLILGIGTLFRGGETSKKYSNKLMQMRVILQYPLLKVYKDIDVISSLNFLIIFHPFLHCMQSMQ